MVITAAVLGLLWAAIDVPAALARIAGAEPRWLLAGLAAVQLQILLSAVRWRVTAARLGHRLGMRRVVREYYVASLLNQVLPGGIGGDAARVVRNRAPVHAPTARVAQGVVLERLAGQCALLLVTLAGVALWPLLLDEPPPRAGLLALAAALLVVLGVALAVAGLTAFGPPRLARFAAGVRPALRRCWFEDGMWLVQGVLSLAVTAGYLAAFAFAALAVGAPLPPVGWLTVVPLALASMLLPISIGGWGLREAAAAALWPLVGLSAESGVAASVVYGLLSLVGSLPAILFLARVGGASSEPERDASAEETSAVRAPPASGK